jgi:hypothetical protein
LREAARAFGTLRAITAKAIQPDIEIGVVAAESTLREHGRYLGRNAACAQMVRIHDHPRQSRRQGQRAQALAFRRDPPLDIERTEFAQ